MVISVNTEDLKKLSATAVIALGLIRSRIQLSERNAWKNEYGTYCLFTASELGRTLDLTERQAKRIMQELVSAGYIMRRRMSSNRSYIYLVGEGQKCPSVWDKNVPQCGTKMSLTYRDNNSDNNIDDPITRAIEDTALKIAVTLTKAEKNEIYNKIRGRAGQIGHLSAYIRTVIRKTVLERTTSSHNDNETTFSLDDKDLDYLSPEEIAEVGTND